jgi:hypothetical protein
MALFVFMAGASVQAAQVCELELLDCPESYNGQTIAVPNNVIGLSSTIHACKSSVVFQNPVNNTNIPSIVFVIDNSGSMRNTNDRTGTRFTVTKALLDTIYKAQPQAEVSLVAFREHLFFDVKTTDYFTKYFRTFTTTIDNEPDQAYLPLIKLNQTYDGKLGIDIIKDILQTDSTGSDLVYQPLYRYARPNDGGGETNINGAFLAAQQALVAAKNPPMQQFVIFLSDGEPAGTTQAGLPPDWFTRGENMPTTFTVYFTSSGTAPQSLQNMNQNIRNNGYSATNPQSTLWTIQTNFNDLMRLFMQHIMTTILVPGSPTRLVVNGTRVSTTYIDSNFVFGSYFPLTDSVTPFNFSISYRYMDENDNVVKDSVITSTFNIRRTNTTFVPANIALLCQQISDSIPVTATLLDTNRNGHIDRITLTWTDTAAMRQAMPSVAEFIARLQVTTYDDKQVDLHAAQIVPDLANKTIVLILTENTGTTLETGFDTAQVVLTRTPMTVSGRPMVVMRTVDGMNPDQYTIGVINNPFVPGQTAIPDAVQKYYQEVISHAPNTPGALIAIKTARPLDQNADGTFGKVRVYDAVANIVRDDLHMYRAAIVTDYGVFWDGRNRNGRYVGNGTYLMTIETKDIEGRKKTMRTKIGVRR